MKSSIQLSALALILMVSCGHATGSDSATPTYSAEPKVMNVWPTNLALGGTITVVVTNLAAWAQESPDNDPTKLVPLINGRQLDGLYPTETYLRSSVLRFRLALTDANKDTWTSLLGKPKSYGYPVSFTVGMGGKERFATEFDYKHKNLRLTVISGYGALFSLTFAALTGIVLIQLSRKTDLIRDNTNHPPPAGERRPYSLGRAQMAFWFFLVLTSYVGLWLITGSLETITPSILAIMGISAGTTIGAALIDADKNEEKSALGSGDTVSKGFLKDLLSNGDAYSFHRFQIFGWTLVLGIIFADSVYERLQMPEFNSTLLGLMGISAGAYVGLKIPEK